MESSGILAKGLVVRELSPLTSNWRADISLDDWLKEEGVAGIFGIDTRALVHHLRLLDRKWLFYRRYNPVTYLLYINVLIT